SLAFQPEHVLDVRVGIAHAHPVKVRDHREGADKGQHPVAYVRGCGTGLGERFVHTCWERAGVAARGDGVVVTLDAGAPGGKIQPSPSFFSRLTSVLRAMPRARAASALLPSAAASARTRNSRSRRSRSARSTCSEDGSAEVRWLAVASAAGPSEPIHR